MFSELKKHQFFHLQKLDQKLVRQESIKPFQVNFILQPEYRRELNEKMEQNKKNPKPTKKTTTKKQPLLAPNTVYVQPLELEEDGY